MVLISVIMIFNIRSINKTIAQENMMTASNLSICVGPSLIWTMDQSYMMEQNYSKEVSSLVQILIEQYHSLFDTNTPELFCQAEAVRSEAGASAGAKPGLESAGAPAERTSSLTSNKGEKAQSKQSKGEKRSITNIVATFGPEDLSSLSPLNEIAGQQHRQIGQFVIYNSQLKRFVFHCDLHLCAPLQSPPSKHRLRSLFITRQCEIS